MGVTHKENQDPEMLTIIDTVSSFLTPLYFVDLPLFVKTIRILLNTLISHGNSVHSCYIMAWTGN